MGVGFGGVVVVGVVGLGVWVGVWVVGVGVWAGVGTGFGVWVGVGFFGGLILVRLKLHLFYNLT